MNSLSARIEIIKIALRQTEKAPHRLTELADRILLKNKEIYTVLVRDETISSSNEPTNPTIWNRLNEVSGNLWRTTSAPTTSYVNNYQIAADEFRIVLRDLQSLIEIDAKNLESEMDKLKAPWTPGRIPDWKE